MGWFWADNASTIKRKNDISACPVMHDKVTEAGDISACPVMHDVKKTADMSEGGCPVLSLSLIHI